MSDQQSGAAQPAISSRGALDDAINGLTQVIMSLPVWIRAVVTVIIVIIAGWIAYWKYAPANRPPVAKLEPSISVAYSQQYLAKQGERDPAHPDATDPQTREASHKGTEDLAAAQYHFVHKDDEDPPEVALGPDTDQSNSLHYRYFAKTDRCLYIDRTEAGQHFVQWVKDPQYHLHDKRPVKTAATRNFYRVRLSPVNVSLCIFVLFRRSWAYFPPVRTSHPSPSRLGSA